MATISIPKTWATNDTVTAADLNSNNTTIYNEFNGNIDDDNIKAAANIASSKIASVLTNKTIGTSNLISFNSPQGFLINGRISVTVASNNLTVAIKGLDGNDPSASNPVYVRINNTIRSITAALSKTANAGTNWFNAGSAELATKEIDYFVYLGWISGSSTVGLAFSRIPYGNIREDFNGVSSANEKYLYEYNAFGSGDDLVCIGRFAATLSAGAGYTWTVPTFTTKNLIQRPISNTRRLEYLPAVTGCTSITYTSRTGYYTINMNTITISVFIHCDAVTAGAVIKGMTTPLAAVESQLMAASEWYDLSVATYKTIWPQYASSGVIAFHMEGTGSSMTTELANGDYLTIQIIGILD